MKRGYLLWVGVPLLLGAASFLLSSGLLSREWRAWLRNEPVLECPDVLDLGEREWSELAVGRFTVANRGRAELVIDHVRTNCSCSGLEREEGGESVPVEQLRLAPGGRAELALRVSARGKLGEPARNVVAFRTNDPSRPEVRIEAQIRKITGGVATLPRGVVFGTVPVGAAACQIVEIRDQAVKPRRVAGVSSSNPGRFTVRLLPREATSGGNDRAQEAGTVIGRMEVRLKTEKPGRVDEVIRIELAGEARMPTRIAVMGRVAPAVEISPAVLVLPRASKAGPVYSGKCLCRSTQGKPLLLRVDSASDGLMAQVSPVEGEPNAQVIRIAWNPAADKIGALSGRRSVRLKARVEGLDTLVGIPVHCRRGEGS